MRLYQKSIILFLKILEHNPEHSTKLVIFGEEIYACSRCLGAYTSGLIFWFIFGYIYAYTNITFPFWYIIAFSFSLAALTGIDVITVDLLHIREGNSNLRIFLGFLLGLSVMAYLWLLPESWWFKLSTLVIYFIIAYVIAIFGERLERKRDGEKAQNSES
jgi:uncharacterized membrane protein